MTNEQAKQKAIQEATMRLIIIEDEAYSVPDKEYLLMSEMIQSLNNTEGFGPEYRKKEREILEYFDQNRPSYKSLGKIMLDWRL